MRAKECKIGKIITGKKGCKEYNITTEKAKMEITYRSGSIIEVKILDHQTRKEEIGEVFEVNAEYFRPLENTITKI